MKYARHELSAKWPDMSREDFDNLEASIKEHGLRDPITIFEGEVLDGWHRYQACESVGIDGATVEFTGSYEEARVLIKTRHARRNLTPGVFAACVLGMYESRTGSGSNRKQIENCTGAVLSTKELAEKAGVSERTIAKVKAAVAIDPEALEKIRTGKTTASKILKASKPAKPAAAAAPAMIVAEVHDKLKESYNELADRAQDMATALESYADVKDGDAAKALIQVRNVLKAVETRRDELTRECAEHIKTIRYYKNRAERFEKELENMKATAL